MNNQTNLDSVEDTLYVPLLGRIYVSKHFPDFFYDKKSLELEETIPAEKINANNSEYYYIASAARYFLADREIHAFIKKYPQSTIVNIGAGFETSYYRINSKTAEFYELDLPHVIHARRMILPEQKRQTFIAGSFFNVEWTKKIDFEKPTLVTALGLFHYFPIIDIINFLKELRTRLNHVEIIFDTTNKAGMRVANRFVEKTGNNNAPMYFYVNDARAFFQQVSSEITQVDEYPFYTDVRPLLKGKVSFGTQCMMWGSDIVQMVKVVRAVLHS